MDQASLAMSLIKCTHGMDGVVFGRCVRIMFFGSPEFLDELDVVFDDSDCLAYFLRVIKVDYSLAPKSQHLPNGLNEFHVFHQSYPMTAITLRIHSFHAGMKSRTRFPSHLFEPCFDIDHVLWLRDGLYYKPPKTIECCTESYPSMLGRAIELVQRRRFSVVNPIAIRSPEAFIITMRNANKLIESAGFTMEEGIPGFPLLLRTDGKEDLICPISQDKITNVKVQLNCKHEFSLDGLLEWVQKKQMETNCPLCKSQIFIHMNQGFF